MDEERRVNSPPGVMFGSLNRNDLVQIDDGKSDRNNKTGKNQVVVIPTADYNEEYQQKISRKKTSEELQADLEAMTKKEVQQFMVNAGIQSRAGNLRRAADLYTKALKLDQKNIECLLLRAQCYFDLKNYKACIKDTEQVLSRDNTITKAIGLKAESQYMIGEFEDALVSFHKAKRLRPGIRAYSQGIDRTKQAIENAIGESSGIKLDLTGDLSHFEQYIEGKNKENSAYRRATRWDKSRKSSAKSVDSARAAPDPKTVKQLLQELYGDYEYLEKLLSEEEKQLQKIDAVEQEKDEQRKRKGETKQDQENEDEAETEPNYLYHSHSKKQNNDLTINERQKQRRKGTSSGIKKVVTRELDFLHQRTEFYRKLQPSKGSDEAGPRPDSVTSVGTVNSTDELIGMMEQIEADLNEGKYNLCLKRCQKALDFIRRQLYSDLSNRDEFEATVYSFMGNAYFEMEDFPSALEHHKRDLEIAKKLELAEAYSRALDNIGRTYSAMGKYTEAISIFEEKLGLAKGDLEATWLHHELGRCFLEKCEFERAVDHAQRSLSAAEEAQDNAWMLNATVLTAQIHEAMKNFDESLEQFENAMRLARAQRDKDAQTALLTAIREVKQKKKNHEQGIEDAEEGQHDEVEEQNDETADLRDQIQDDNEENQVDGDSPEDIKRQMEEANQENEEDRAEDIRDQIKEANKEEEEEEKEEQQDIRDSIKKSNKSNSKKPTTKKTTKQISSQIKKTNAKKENEKPPPKQHIKVNPQKNLDKSPYKNKVKKDIKKKSPEKEEEAEGEATEENQNEVVGENEAGAKSEAEGENEAGAQSEAPADIRDQIKASNADNLEEETDIMAEIQASNAKHKEEEEEEKNEDQAKSEEAKEVTNDNEEDPSQLDIKNLIKTSNTEEKPPPKQTEKDEFFD